MRKILLLALMMFVTVTLSAQVGVNVGPKIGYQASKLSFKKSDMKYSLNSDLNLGVFTRFTFNRFIIQPEVLFSCQNMSVKLNNLSVPVMFGFKLLDDKNFKMRANVGPVAYFTVGNKSAGARRAGMGTALGLGVDIWRLTLDLNYSLGLTNIFDDIFNEVSKAKQNIFTLTLGFKLRY